ncbi:MAG: hypothetical protein JSV79_03515 [Armatimonadota bacterium]|nr:MAG: hypothetical protein JSV79_03515 [Armatimonadota bacterium]
MSSPPISDKDRKMAERCVECPMCVGARRKQKGFAFWFVRLVEGGLCPYCKAYERVYGRRAHEPVPTETE